MNELKSIGATELQNFVIAVRAPFAEFLVADPEDYIVSHDVEARAI